MMKAAYIWMSSDSLDDAFVEMTGVSKKTTGNIVRVPKPAEGSHGKLRPFVQVPLRSFNLNVLVLDPAMM